MLRPKLNRLWASGSANRRRDPGDAKYIQGWVSEIPTYQVLNFLQYKIDTTMLAHAERGVFEWGEDITYTRGALAWDEVEKAIYVSSAVGPSKTLRPGLNPSQWNKSSVGVTREQYDSVSNAITSHIANITGNPHQLTPGRLGAYTKAETDALVNQYRALVSAHASDTNNPHKLTALVIGAVPSTGGTYTGDVIFQTGRIYLNEAKSAEIGATASGAFLQTSGGKIGISSTGVPTAGPKASQSGIVLDSTFADLKAIVEPNYSSIAEDFGMQLSGDINIYRGGGTSQTNFNEVFPSYNALRIPALGNNRLVLDFNPLVDCATLTVAVDIRFVTASGTQVDAYTMQIGSGNGSLRWIISTGGRMYLTSPGVITGEYYIPAPTNWNRFVVVSTRTETKMYANGVLVLTSPLVRTANITGSDFVLSSVGIQSGVAVDFKNWRSWRSNLTDKQVSAL